MLPIVITLNFQFVSIEFDTGILLLLLGLVICVNFTHESAADSMDVHSPCKWLNAKIDSISKQCVSQRQRNNFINDSQHIYIFLSTDAFFVVVVVVAKLHIVSH